MGTASAEPQPDGWLVLQVAFGDPELARRSWEELHPLLDIDTIAHEVHGVFPQLAKGLRALEVDSPLLARLDGVRRRLWTRNSLRVREVLRARTSLDSHDIVVEPTAGLATLLRQSDLGARPLVDAELVVDSEHQPGATRTLLAEGWTQLGARRDGWLMDLHAATFERAGHQLTLRWSDGRWPYPSDPNRVWASPAGGRSLRLPSSASLLAYTLVEGHRLWGYTPVRRYADLLLLLSESGPVDWAHLVTTVRERAGAGAASRALRTVDTHFPGMVPQEALAELSDATTRRTEWAVDLGERSGTVAAIVRRMEATTQLRTIAGTPALLREVWGVESGRALALAGARRLKARWPGADGHRSGRG